MTTRLARRIVSRYASVAPVIYKSVSDNPAKWESKTKSWPQEIKHFHKSKKFKDFTLYWKPSSKTDWDIVAVTDDGEVVGHLFYGNWDDNPHEEDLEGAVEVNPKYRRQGLATALYTWAEKLTGRVFRPASSHTPLAEALWNNPGRSFGKKPKMSTERIAARYLVAAGYFNVGDKLLYGKYKNKIGILKAFGQDKWGNPTIEVEPVPKGRKKNKIIGLYKIWRADVKEKALAEQAAAGGAKLAVDPVDPEDEG